MISISASGSGARFLIGGPHSTCLRCVRREIGRRGERGRERGRGAHRIWQQIGICSMLWHMWHILDQAAGQPADGADGQPLAASCGGMRRRVQRRTKAGSEWSHGCRQSAAAFAGLAGLVESLAGTGSWAVERERVESGWRDRVIGAVGGSSTALEGEAQCSNTPVAGAVDNTGGRG
jgi:hypothetical protein